MIAYILKEMTHERCHFIYVGQFVFMINARNIHRHFLQFMWYRTFVLLTWVCHISACVFPLYWLEISDLMELLSDQWYVRWCDKVMVVKLMYILFQLLLDKKKTFLSCILCILIVEAVARDVLFIFVFGVLFFYIVPKPLLEGEASCSSCPRFHQFSLMGKHICGDMT